MKKTSRHDKLVLKLEERLKQTGWKTTTFKEYHNKHGDGEIDLYATKNGYRALFEVKTSLRPKNWKYAHNQMDRAITNYFKYDNTRTFCFFAHYDNYKADTYYLHWVDPKNPKYLL